MNGIEIGLHVFLSREIIQPLCSCFCTQRAHCAALHFYALSSRGQCANKASNSSNKLLIEAKAACKSDVCSGSCFPAHHLLSDRFVKRCCCPSLWHRVVYLTSHCGCLCFNFPKCRSSPVSHFSFTFLPFWETQAKSTFFVFTAPLISSCFVPPLAAPDIAWCAEGMQLPEEFPHLPPRS